MGHPTSFQSLVSTLEDCFILDDHIDPRCSVLFLARSVLTEF